jgi:hypothetical protein
MRAIFYFSLIVLACVSCKKEQTTREVLTKQPVAVSLTTAQPDTIPDGSCFKLRLQKDSTPIDETSLFFKHAAKAEFNPSQDAQYFQGFGTGSLASVTSDGVLCAIQTLPCTAGAAIRLNAVSKKDGAYILRLSFVKSLAGSQIWLHDRMNQDSVNLRTGNYAFDVNTADTSSYGSNRFRVILR